MWASYPTSWDVTQQYLCTFCSQFSASVCSNTAIRTPSHMLSGKVMYATRLGEGTQLLPMWIQSPGSTRPSLCHQLPRMLHLQPLPRKRMPPNLAPKNLPIFLLAKILYQHFGWSFIYCILIYRYINTCTRIYNSFSSYFYSISSKKKKKPIILGCKKSLSQICPKTQCPPLLTTTPVTLMLTVLCLILLIEGTTPSTGDPWALIAAPTLCAVMCNTWDLCWTWSSCSIAL